MIASRDVTFDESSKFKSNSLCIKKKITHRILDVAADVPTPSCNFKKILDFNTLEIVSSGDILKTTKFTKKLNILKIINFLNIILHTLVTK